MKDFLDPPGPGPAAGYVPPVTRKYPLLNQFPGLHANLSKMALAFYSKPVSLLFRVFRPRKVYRAIERFTGAFEAVTGTLVQMEVEENKAMGKIFNSVLDPFDKPIVFDTELLVEFLNIMRAVRGFLLVIKDDPEETGETMVDLNFIEICSEAIRKGERALMYLSASDGLK